MESCQLDSSSLAAQIHPEKTACPPNRLGFESPSGRLQRVDFEVSVGWWVWGAGKPLSYYRVSVAIINIGSRVEFERWVKVMKIVKEERLGER